MLARRLLDTGPGTDWGGAEGASAMRMSRFLPMLVGAAALMFAASELKADTDVKFALDWKFEGPSAPYFVAIDKGYYKAEGLRRQGARRCGGRWRLCSVEGVRQRERHR